MSPVNETVVSEEVMRQIAPIIGKYQGQPDMLMRMLLEIQEVSGNAIPQNVAVYISRATGIPVAKIFDFTHFYSMFSASRRGHYVIQMCDSAPCHVCGSKNVAQAFIDALGISKAGETTSDGVFTFEYCQCLGVCDHSPAALIGDQVYGDLTEASAKELVSELRNGVNL